MCKPDMWRHHLFVCCWLCGTLIVMLLQDTADPLHMMLISWWSSLITTGRLTSAGRVFLLAGSNRIELSDKWATTLNDVDAVPLSGSRLCCAQLGQHDWAMLATCCNQLTNVRQRQHAASGLDQLKLFFNCQTCEVNLLEGLKWLLRP